VSAASAMRFLASGGFNTLVTYLLYLLLLKWLPYQQSYSIAFASGIGLAYVLNRYYVFKRPGGPLGPLYVTMIYAGQYLLGLLIVSAWVDWLHAPPKLAPLIAIAISLPLVYLCNARVFGHRPGTDDGQATIDAGHPAGLLIRRVALCVLVGLPLASLALNAVAWVQFGLDLPFFDDWRAYITGQMDSLDPSYLFVGINSTLAPVGYALDALAQRALDGNSVVYQLLSMLTVLGLLLLLQWKLLNAALGNRIEAAVCFVFTLLMLQPGSYWGRENLAYHQALPLVFLLAALWLIAFSQWRNLWRLPAILALGVLAGLTYVSGAFGGFAAAIGVLFVALFGLPPGRRARVAQGAVALAIAGAGTAVAQFRFGVQPSMTTRPGDPTMAMPREPDFWLFLLGKIGRSLLLPETWPVLSFLLVLVACVAALAIAFVLLKRLRADPDGSHAGVAVVLGALGAMVFVYLMLVAAGRTHLHGPEVNTAMGVFAYGFSRFHFFWVDLLWPWVVAAAVVLLRGRRTSWTPASAVLSPLTCAAAIVLMVWGGAFGHFGHHRMEASFRKATVTCLMTQLQRGNGIDCPEFNIGDLTPAYVYARRVGASFVRYFPVLPAELGLDDPPPWFRLGRDPANVELYNMTAAPGGYVAGPDPRLTIRLGRAEEMENCVMLDVTAVVSASQDDMVQLYFRPRGQAQFSESSSSIQALKGGAGPAKFAFRLESQTGFEDSLRLDPVNKAQEFTLPQLEVRCRLSHSTRPFFELDQPPKPVYMLDSAQLDPVIGDLGAYRAGDESMVAFRTDRPMQMRECNVLAVEVQVTAQREARAQVFFMPRGEDEFIEKNTATLAVRPMPGGQPQPLEFRFESSTGFDNKLRFDPVDAAQDIRLTNVKVSCRRHLSSARALSAAVAGPRK
jgi:putative flippase GtrA